VLDGLRLAIPATLLALGIGYAWQYLMVISGRLTVFGITLHPPVSIPLIIGIAIGGIFLALLGALTATLSLLFVPPTQLFYHEDHAQRGEKENE
ncbi:MAG: hypothetical protein ABEI86_04260, partial [Halobacteriaceae archaeon]